jgi:putative membrane protein
MSEPEPRLADVLAIERTRMAADRTLMGWIRTALSMIGFGFTIFKFLEYMKEQGLRPAMRPHGPWKVGLRWSASGPLP